MNSGWTLVETALRKDNSHQPHFFLIFIRRRKGTGGNKLDMISSADCYIKGAINSETKTKNAKSDWTLVELWLIFSWSSVVPNDITYQCSRLYKRPIQHPISKKILLFKKWLNGLIHKFVLLLTNVEPETMSSITLGEIEKDSGVLLWVRSIKRMGHHSVVTNVKKNSRISSRIIM